MVGLFLCVFPVSQQAPHKDMSNGKPFSSYKNTQTWNLFLWDEMSLAITYADVVRHTVRLTSTASF